MPSHKILRKKTIAECFHQNATVAQIQIWIRVKIDQNIPYYFSDDDPLKLRMPFLQTLFNFLTIHLKGTFSWPELN